MEEMICGTCSQEQGLPIEERIKLALSRIPMTKYKCPVCDREHFFNRVVKESSHHENRIKAEEKPKKANSKKKKEPDTVQLSLF